MRQSKAVVIATQYSQHQCIEMVQYA